MIKLYKEITNEVSLEVGHIDDDFIRDISTAHIKINYDGYFKIDDADLSIEVIKNTIDVVVKEILANNSVTVKKKN